METKELMKRRMVKVLLTLAGGILTVGWLVVAAKKNTSLEKTAFATKTKAPSARTKGKKIAVKLHGSTPSMAWSPDGKHLAFNAAFEYYGFSGQTRTYSGKLGIFALDVKKGKVRRITSMQGYHPLWLTNKVLAWGHSPYEKNGKAGLFMAKLKRKGTPKVKKVGSLKGVYHTLPAKKKGVLLYSGFPEYKRWIRFHVRTKKITKVKTSGKRKGWGSSWSPPPGKYKNQCLQKVGNIRVKVDSSDGRIYLTTSSATIQLPHTSYSFHNYGSKRSCSVTGHCGPMKACLSPKGKYVAYFASKQGKANYTLYVAPVPR